jgi:hypothetical protein
METVQTLSDNTLWCAAVPLGKFWDTECVRAYIHNSHKLIAYDGSEKGAIKQFL